MGEYNINGLAIPMFLLFMVVEYAFLRLTGRNLHRYNDNVTSLSMGLCLLVSDALLKAYTFAVFIYLWGNHRLMEFGSGEPITWIVFFIGSGCANLYVAFNFDEAVWVNFKLFGLLGLTIVFIIGQSIYLARHAIETSNEDKEV